jgi:hypothetical protein
MSREVLVDETVNALWRVLGNGEIRPTSFIWRDKTRYVAEVGRSWEERVGGKTLRCYLIQAADGSAYELRWDPASDVWQVHRAWLRDLMA